MASSIGSVVLLRPRAAGVAIRGDQLHLALRDGREVSVPIAWFDWLAAASESDRADVTILEDGAGLWWERLDDGISVPWLMGVPEVP